MNTYIQTYRIQDERKMNISEARAARKLTQRIRGAYLDSVSGVRAIRVGMCAHY